jgi:hypothetical protein
MITIRTRLEALRTPMKALILGGLFMSLCCFDGTAHAQGLMDMSNTAPIVGGTTVVNSTPKFGQARSRLHMSPAGLPCINIGAFSRPQIINPTTFDNVVVLKNACAEAISLKICYFETDHCTTPNIDGYKRREQVLGSTASKDFRYEYREIFK